MASHIQTQLERICALLAGCADIIAERVDAPEPPPWAECRGWPPFLLDLADDDVARAEREGLSGVDTKTAPDDLHALCGEAHSLTATFVRGPRSHQVIARQHVPLRKRMQVAAVINELRQDDGHTERIVDVGAGHGHLCRAAHEALGVHVLGVDHDGARIRVARSLAGDAPIPFVIGSVDAIELRRSDLVIGLHACGALGDALLVHVAKARCRVLLISCCQQKIDTPHRPALSAGGCGLGLDWPREALGLSNLSWGAAADKSMRGRETRHALRLLLRDRGANETSGSVAHGVHKKRFRQGLAAVAAQALRRRGLAAASTAEICTFEKRGAVEFSHMRRLSLPRNLLGRLMELAIVFDRARFLEERGYQVHVRAAFDTDISPRNLGITGSPPE